MALGADAALPDATAAVRKLAQQEGPVPSNRRNGTLVLAQLRRAQGSCASYVVAAQDQAHTFYALITLRQQYARWVVVQLTPPAGPPAPAPPRASATADTAARGFLHGYLP
jgi:hypothetical protein